MTEPFGQPSSRPPGSRDRNPLGTVLAVVLTGVAVVTVAKVIRRALR